MKVAINGFGRIGRQVLRAGLERGINFVAINDPHDIEGMVYLLKYDSVYGNFKGKIKHDKRSITINGKKIKVLSDRNPENLPWKKLKVDVVVESTGAFRDKEGASKHLKAGAKKVLISAPSKNPDITVVYGVNHQKLNKNHKIISVASCTTNCLAPIAKLINDSYGIKKAFMTTVHAYTSSQSLVDGPARKLRRGRAAAGSIVPTTSGATTATAEAIPELKGRLDGLAMRVPVLNGSIVDFTADIKKRTTVKRINNMFKKASNGKLKGILSYTEDELVSVDIIGSPYSAIISGKDTQVLGNLVKVLAWYDNEYGYSCRMVDVIKLMRRFL